MNKSGRLFALLVSLLWLGAWSGSANSAVTFQAAGTAVSGRGAVTPTWPAHAIGDIALLFVESAGGEAATLSTPATFVAVASSPQSIGATTAGTRLSVFWARATSAAMASPVVADPGDHVYAQIITYRGAIATGNPWDVTGGGITAPRTLTLGAVTTTVANTLVVQAASRDNDSTAADFSAQTNAGLSGITERSDAGTNSGTGGGFAVWDGVRATAGAVGSTTAALAASVSNAYLSIALRPSGASAPTVQAQGTAVFGTGAVNVAWPAHAVNDIALLFVESAGGEAVTLSTPATFAAVTGSPQAIGTTTAGTRLSVFWARATSTAMAPPVVADPGNHVYARIITYRGVATSGNPWDVTGGGTDSNLSVSGVTTTVANTLVVQAASREDDSAAAAFSAQTNVNLSGITERSDLGTNSGNGGGFAVWDGGKATAGATGNTTVTRAVTTSTIVGNPFLTIALKPFVPPLDHIRIEHDGLASNCAAEPITIKACANATCTAPHYIISDVTGITLAATGSGIIWTPGNPQTITAASGGINSGITLARSNAGTATLSITGTPSPAPAAVYECYNTSTLTSGDCGLVFSDNLAFNVSSHVADTRQAVTITVCAGSFASTTRTVKLWSTYVNPASGSRTGNVVAGTGNADCTTGYSSLGTSLATATSLGLNFGTGTTPQATFSLCYPDAGQVKLDARYDGAAGNTPPDAGVVKLGNSTFIAKPDHFTLSGIKCTTANAANCAPGALAMATPGDNPAAGDQTGGSFVRAGDSTQTSAKFTATITAKSARNNTTPNFGIETAPGPEGIKMTSVLVAPSGGSAGLLTCKASASDCVVPGGAASFSNGATTVTDMAWSEAGIVQVLSTFRDGDYLGTGEIGTPTASGNIGRFIPDRFLLTTDTLNPVLLRKNLTQTTAIASGTTAPATVIGVDATTGFAVGNKVRIPGAGAAGAAFTATVTAVDSVGATLTLDTPIATTVDPGDIVIEEWGSYMGEGMTAQFILDAVNVGGAATTNYRGVYAKLNPAVAGNPFVFGAVSGGTNLTARLDTSAAASGSFAAGSATVDAPIAISRVASPDGPYAAVKIGIAPVDSDGVKMAQPYDLNVGGSLDHTSIMSATVQATTEVRFGRLRLINAYGSELIEPRVDYRVEYWNGNRWITNTVDSWAPFVAGNVYDGGLGAPSSVTGPTGGTGVITFNTAAVGSYDIAVNLNAAGNDTSCNTTGHGGAAANTPWLQGYWSAKASCNNTDPWLQDPNARVKLGSPKAPFIYMRERY